MERLSVLLLFCGWGEPAHVHVGKAGKEAKIWLNDCSVAINLGYSAREIGDIVRETRKRRAALLEAWNDHFADRS